MRTRSHIARDLRTHKYRARIIRSKKLYDRKRRTRRTRDQPTKARECQRTPGLIVCLPSKAVNERHSVASLEMAAGPWGAGQHGQGNN
jgi:hypothetical protein